MITCVYVCVCSCVCVYLCILLAVSVCTNDYVCVCVFMCVCVWLYITMLVCTCANKNVCCLLSMCELRLRMGGYERIWACVKMQLHMRMIAGLSNHLNEHDKIQFGIESGVKSKCPTVCASLRAIKTEVTLRVVSYGVFV